VRLLERGDDDVLVKPFSYPEPRARIAAVLGAPPPAGHSHSCSPARCARSTRPQRVRRRATGEALSGRIPAVCQLAGEPTRVLTKVHFETRPEEGKGSDGFGGWGLGW
jgi:DNA-binding response OmpR family regulator